MTESFLLVIPSKPAHSQAWRPAGGLPRWSSTVSIPDQRTKVPHTSRCRQQGATNSSLPLAAEATLIEGPRNVRSRSVAPPCGPTDDSPSGSPAHGIFQARTLEWDVTPYSGGSSGPRDQTHVSCVPCIGRRILYHYHLTQEKGAVTPQETDPDLPGRVQESPAEALVSGGLDWVQQCVQGTFWRRWRYLHHLHHSLVSGQTTGREHSQRSNCQHPSNHRENKSSRKTSTSTLLTVPKPLTVWIITNCEKFLKRWNTRPPDLPPEKSVCRSRSNS